MTCDVNPAVHRKIQEILAKYRNDKGLEGDLNDLVQQMHDARHAEEQAQAITTVEEAVAVQAASQRHTQSDAERNKAVRDLFK